MVFAGCSFFLTSTDKSRALHGAGICTAEAMLHPMERTSPVPVKCTIRVFNERFSSAAGARKWAETRIPCLTVPFLQDGRRGGKGRR